MQQAMKLLDVIDNMKDKLTSDEYLTVVNLIQSISKSDLYKVTIIYPDVKESLITNDNFETITNIFLKKTTFISRFKSDWDKKDYMLETIDIIDLPLMFEDIPSGLVKNSNDLIGAAEIETEEEICISQKIYKSFNFIDCIVTTSKWS